MPAPVAIRTLDGMPDLVAAAGLLNALWSAELVPTNLARAVQHSGGYVAGAFVGGALVGASLAFLGRHDGQVILHSHITGVLPDHRGIGARLKHHQREWCAARDIAAITWTFDPLVARNAYFNLHKLGAVATAYLPDHYGAMADGVNAGEESDRLHVWWPVTPDRTPPAVEASAATLLLDVGAEEEPRAHGHLPSDGQPLALRIPADIEALRATRPDRSARWRRASRAVFQPAYAAGYRATDVSRDGTYLLTMEAGGA